MAVYVDNLRKERTAGEGQPQLLCWLLSSEGLVLAKTVRICPRPCCWGMLPRSVRADVCAPQDDSWRWSDGGTGPGSLVTWDHIALPYDLEYPLVQSGESSSRVSDEDSEDED